MKKVKQLTLSSVLGLGLAVFAMQTASAADVYAQVSAETNKAAKFAVSKGWTGAKATCFIAERGRVVARKNGLKDNSPELQAMISKTTYKSATDFKVKELLENRVTIRCKSGGAIITGLPRSAAIVGGSVLAIGAIAALSNSSDDNNNVAGSRAPVSAE